MIPQKPAPDWIRGGYRFSEKACPRESGGSNNKLERDDELKKSHHTLVATALLACDHAAVVPFDRGRHHTAVMPWADRDAAWADPDRDVPPAVPVVAVPVVAVPVPPNLD